jgi:drug/metabolite transporter (DMT)-like permease
MTYYNRLSDITAIWNTNAFFAYVITVRLFKLNWEPRKLLSVLFATFGVMAVVYGDARVSDAVPGPDAPTRVASNDSVKPKAPVLGDLLTLCASVGYGIYQVMYKRYAAISSDPEFVPGGEYLPLPDSANHATAGLSEGCNAELDDLVYPPPFGLHPNLLACGIGLMSLFTLWILLPIVHYSGYERFRLPDSPSVILSIAGVACTGLVFNSGILVGPTHFCVGFLSSH